MELKDIVSTLCIFIEAHTWPMFIVDADSGINKEHLAGLKPGDIVVKNPGSEVRTVKPKGSEEVINKAVTAISNYVDKEVLNGKS